MTVTECTVVGMIVAALLTSEEEEANAQEKSDRIVHYSNIFHPGYSTRNWINWIEEGIGIGSLIDCIHSAHPNDFVAA
jgi:hypothetical protein